MQLGVCMAASLGLLVHCNVALAATIPHAGTPPQLERRDEPPRQGMPCGGAQAGSAWCDGKKPLDVRVGALVAALTLAEKAGLMNNYAKPVPRLDLPLYDWWNEAVHGFARVQVNDGSVHVNATSFPMSIGVASAFNRSLWREVGGVVGREARGAANANLYGVNALTFWAPNINVARDSRWGRNQETPGEDPLTNGEYAKALTTGMQGNDSTWLQVSSCAKHFAVHSWNTPSNYMAHPSKQDLADTYLPAFEAAARAGVSGFMCSYNGVDGMPMCAQQDLLTKVRSEWKFQGYITSDCGAVGNPNYKKKGWTSPKDIIGKSLSAGMDSDCGHGRDTFGKDMLSVMQNNSEIVTAVNKALVHLFRVQFRLGMFDKPDKQPAWAKYGAEQINTPRNRQVVLEAAQQGLVLLLNKHKTLPLSRVNVKRLALVGPNVENIETHDCGDRKEPSYLGCEGCYCANAQAPVSPLQGFSAHVDKLDFAPGCADIMCDLHHDPAARKLVAAAVAAASQADATVAIIGLDTTQECEGLDRIGGVSMPGGQNNLTALVCAAAAARGAPCVVLIMGGSAVDSEPIEKNPNVSAVMWVGYPGERGGEAIANAVFGMQDSFGKLPFSVYKAAYYEGCTTPPPLYEGCLSPLDFSMRPNASSNNPGRTYRFYNGPLMLHPFGSGLQYNSWTLAPLVLSSQRLSLTQLAATASAAEDDAVAEVLQVSVRAWHQGSFASSSVVVLAFAVPPGRLAGQDGRPLRTLVGFERVETMATDDDHGTKGGVLVTLSLAKRAFQLADRDGTWSGQRGNWTIEIEVGEMGSSATVQVV